MTVAPRSNSLKSSLIATASERSFKNRRDHWAALPFTGAFQGWRAHLSFRVVYLLAFLEGCVSGRQPFPEFCMSARQFDYVQRCETYLLHTVSSFLLTESHLLIKVDVVQLKHNCDATPLHTKEEILCYRQGQCPYTRWVSVPSPEESGFLASYTSTPPGHTVLWSWITCHNLNILINLPFKGI